MIKGYFMQKKIFANGEELPPRKTNIVMIGETLDFNLDNYDDDDDINVMDEDGDWFVIKKNEIILL